MSEPKAPIALMSRTWSCASLSEGLNVILQDAAQNAGLSDELDSTLLANLEEKGSNLLYRQNKSRPGIAKYQGSLQGILVDIHNYAGNGENAVSGPRRLLGHLPALCASTNLQTFAR